VDILVDDGGHLAEQQIVTLEEMLPHIRRGGVYLCEDVSGADNAFTSYVYGLAKSLDAFPREEHEDEHSVVTSKFQSAIASIHQYPYVVVIEKHRSPVTRLIAPKHGTEWQPFL
jgi:hypothetical protein